MQAGSFQLEILRGWHLLSVPMASVISLLLEGLLHPDTMIDIQQSIARNELKFSNLMLK